MKTYRSNHLQFVALIALAISSSPTFSTFAQSNSATASTNRVTAPTLPPRPPENKKLCAISDAAALKARTLAKLIPLYLAKPVQFEPGTKWKFCQSGMNTAARVVEILSGMTYDSFVQQRILDPLGMTNTTFRRAREFAARIVTAYSKNPTNSQLEAVPPRPDVGGADRPPFGNMGLYSTGPDYARFCQMLLGGGVLDGKRLLSAESIKLMTAISDVGHKTVKI